MDAPLPLALAFGALFLAIRRAAARRPEAVAAGTGGSPGAERPAM